MLTRSIKGQGLWGEGWRGVGGVGGRQGTLGSRTLTGYPKAKSLGKELHSRRRITAPCMDREGRVGARAGHRGCTRYNNLKEKGLG